MHEELEEHSRRAVTLHLVGQGQSCQAQEHGKGVSLKRELHGRRGNRAWERFPRKQKPGSWQEGTWQGLGTVQSPSKANMVFK